jgi:hypothetical protein
MHSFLTRARHRSQCQESARSILSGIRPVCTELLSLPPPPWGQLGFQRGYTIQPRGYPWKPQIRSVLSALRSRTLPPGGIPDWRRLQRWHPRSSQIGVGFTHWILIGVGFSRKAARRKDRRASTCHRERAEKPGVERSKAGEAYPIWLRAKDSFAIC